MFVDLKSLFCAQICTSRRVSIEGDKRGLDRRCTLWGLPGTKRFVSKTAQSLLPVRAERYLVCASMFADLDLRDPIESRRTLTSTAVKQWMLLAQSPGFTMFRRLLFQNLDL